MKKILKVKGVGVVLISMIYIGAFAHTIEQCDICCDTICADSADVVLEKSQKVHNDAIYGDFDGDGIVDQLWMEGSNLYEGNFGTWTLRSDNPSLDKLITLMDSTGALLTNDGNLDDSGCDFLGFVPAYMSSFCSYNLLRFSDGKWKEALKPFSVWLGDDDTVDNRVQPIPGRRGVVRIRYNKMGNIEKVDPYKVRETTRKIKKIN